MPNPGYLVGNLLSAATTFTGTSVDPVYGYEYLYDNKQNIPMRFTGKISEAILAELAAPAAATLMAMINHNLTSAAVIEVSGGPNTGSLSVIGQATWHERNLYFLFPSETHLVWRVEVQDPTNPDIPQMGELKWGVHTALSRHFSYGVQEAEDFINDEHTTERGNVTAYEGYAQESRVFPANNILPTVRAEIRAMYRATKGRLLPLFFMPNIAGNLESFYCRLGPRYAASLVSKSGSDYIYQSSVDLREEPLGASVT